MDGTPTALTPRRAALDEIPAVVLVLRGPELVVEVANRRRRERTAGSQLVGLCPRRRRSSASWRTPGSSEATWSCCAVC